MNTTSMQKVKTSKKTKNVRKAALLLGLFLLFSGFLLPSCGKTPQETADSSLSAEDSGTPAPEDSDAGEDKADGTSDEAPKKERYGPIFDDGTLRYRLVNNSFYEVYGYTEDWSTPMPRNLTVPGSVRGKPVKRIRGAIDFEDHLDDLTPETAFLMDGALAHNGTTLTITIEEGVEEIGEAAFIDCDTLLRIELPASVKTIEKDAFRSCRALSEIKVAEGNPIFKWENGVLFDAETGTVVKCPAASGASSLTFPEGTKHIAEDAFNGCKQLREVILPEGVETVGDSAFRECEQLEKIVFPASLRKLGSEEDETGTGMGYNYMLREIQVAEGNEQYKSVDGVLFTKDGSTLLLYPMNRGAAEYTVPEGVKKIARLALEDKTEYSDFQGSEDIQQGVGILTIPSTLEEAELLFPTRSLHEVRMAGENSHLKVVDGVLFSADGKNLYCYPAKKADAEYRIPDGVETLEDSYFLDGNETLRKLIIPKTFSAAENSLYNLVLPLVKLSALEAVEVEEGNESFRSADGLLYDGSGETLLSYPRGKTEESVTLAPGTKKIDDYTGITENPYLKKLVLPASFESAKSEYGEEWMFPVGLEEIVVEEGNAKYASVDGLLYDGKKQALLYYPPAKKDVTLTLPACTVGIGENAINEPVNLKNLTLPEGVISISYRGVASETLSSLHLPASLVTVSRGAVQLPSGCTVTSAGAKKPAAATQGWLVLGEGYAEDSQVQWNVTP